GTTRRKPPCSGSRSRCCSTSIRTSPSALRSTSWRVVRAWSLAARPPSSRVADRRRRHVSDQRALLRLDLDPCALDGRVPVEDGERDAAEARASTRTRHLADDRAGRPHDRSPFGEAVVEAERREPTMLRFASTKKGFSPAEFAT